MSKWTPQDETALRLAAIRWYTISIEKLSNGLYITDRGKYEAVEDILKRALQELGRIRKSMSGGAVEEGCPPGYVDCDGICMPDCDPIVY